MKDWQEDFICILLAPAFIVALILVCFVLESEAN